MTHVRIACAAVALATLVTGPTHSFAALTVHDTGTASTTTVSEQLAIDWGDGAMGPEEEITFVYGDL